VVDVIVAVVAIVQTTTPRAVTPLLIAMFPFSQWQVIGERLEGAVPAVMVSPTRRLQQKKPVG
jgi:hypothetical protein